MTLQNAPDNAQLLRSPSLPKISSTLVLTSLRVRGLASPLRNQPLVANLVVGQCSILTDTLKPLPSSCENSLSPSVPHAHEATTGDKECTGPQANHVLGLEPLCCVFPLLDEKHCGTGDGNVEHDGLFLGLREVVGTTFLGTAMCTLSGMWVPLQPCGGEVQLTFRVNEQRAKREKNSPVSQPISGEPSPPLEAQQQLQHQEQEQEEVKLATPICLDAPSNLQSHFSPTALVQEEAAPLIALSNCQGAGEKAVSSASSACRADSTQSAKCESPNKKESHATGCAGALPNSGRPMSSKSPSPERFASSALSEGCELRKVLPGANGSLSATSAIAADAAATHPTRLDSGLARDRENQPRSLVFNNISVSGFAPLSSAGNWRLEFSWPQSHVSFPKHTVVIPFTEDECVGLKLSDSFTIDLPLFLRGEMQTNVHAVWNGSDGADERRRLYVKLRFNPIVVAVGDSDLQQSEHRCIGPTTAELGSGLVTISQLEVKLIVTLKFYAPQREGQNGRPISAHPSRQRVGAHENVAEVTQNNSIENAEKGDLHKGRYLEDKDKDEICPENGVTNGRSQPHRAFTSRTAEADYSCANESAFRQWIGDRLKTAPSRPVTKREEPHILRKSSAPVAESRFGSRQTGRTIRDLVPCYTEEQRVAAFRLYDADSRGYITQEQLVDFCRAHEALFDAEESDANIVRALQGYFPRKPRPRATAEVASLTNTPSLLLQTRKPYSDTILKRLEQRRLLGLGGRALHLRDTAGATEYTRVSIKRVPYNVFEVIALRLASL